jgi:cell wall-associated NlpC family hydrolase
MSTRAVLACLLCLTAAATPACGGGDDGGGRTVQAWRVGAPYLPPPDPSAYVKPSVAPSRTATPKRDAAAGRSSAGTPRTPTAPASGAPTDAQVAADLKQAYGGSGGPNVDQAAIDGAGLALVPPTAPGRLVALMHAANEVARKPYVYGGGHGRNPKEVWEDSAYDCSGSVSYALAAAGYLKGPEASTGLMSFGRPGPGRWVSIYANAGHAFMVVAGLRFDTSGRQVTGTRWQDARARSYSGFTVRHPPGL